MNLKKNRRILFCTFSKQRDEKQTRDLITEPGRVTACTNPTVPRYSICSFKQLHRDYNPEVHVHK